MGNNECCGGKDKKSNGMGGMMPPMAKTMMGKMSGEGFNPMEMCKQMTETVTETAKMAGFATPEVQAMFDDWVTEVEKEILKLISDKGQLTPESIAEELKISEDSALYFISKLIRDKKVKVTGVELA